MAAPNPIDDLLASNPARRPAPPPGGNPIDSLLASEAARFPAPTGRSPLPGASPAANLVPSRGRTPIDDLLASENTGLTAPSPAGQANPVDALLAGEAAPTGQTRFEPDSLTGDIAHEFESGLHAVRRAHDEETQRRLHILPSHGGVRDFAGEFLTIAGGLFNMATAPLTGAVRHYGARNLAGTLPAQPAPEHPGLFRPFTNPISGASERARQSAARPFDKSGTPEEQLERATNALALPVPGIGVTQMPRLSKLPQLFAAPAGPNPLKEFTQVVADDLHRLRQTSTADRAEVMERVAKAPAAARTADVQETVYNLIENGQDISKLPAKQLAALNDPKHADAVIEAIKHIQPMRLELSNLYSRLRKLGIPETDLVDPDYVHRRAVGHSPALDTPAPGVAADPIMGVHTLPTSTSALWERKMLGGQAADGHRMVISQDPAAGVSVHIPGSKAPHPARMVDDEHFAFGGRTYKIGNSTSLEIERATAAEKTPVKYHKNALANTADALTRMRAVARHVEWLDNLKKSSQWQRFATQRKDIAYSKGWKPSTLPQLDGWYVEPKLRAAFDDFYKPGAGESELLTGMRKMNQFGTASMFWNPTPHIENVLGHWVVGRGFDWITPAGARSLIMDGARAIRAVTTQNSDYRRLLKAGSGMIFGGVKNADFYTDVARLAGMQIEREPNKWDPIARTLGIGPSDLVRAIYDGSRRTLWWANDIFMAQRVFELERKGMPLRRAVREAEKHIPNYRIPTEVMGSRMFSQLLQEPAFTVFSRYHYGVFKSYANMVRDLVSRTSSPRERIDAIGNMMALGLLTWVVYPALDAGLQRLTGDDSATKLRRGPASFPSAVSELYEGNRQWPELVSSVITVPAFTKLATSALTGGHDPFTGHPITEPGSPGGEQAVQAADYALGQLVQPYGLLSQRPEDEGGRSTGRLLADQLIGAKNTSPASQRGRLIGKKIERKRAIKREVHPRGPLERVLHYGGTSE